MEKSQKRNIEKQLAKQIQNELWLAGELGFILMPHQEKLYLEVKEFLLSDPNKRGLKYIVNCARRFGKTFILLLIAVEFCILNPNSHVRFAAPSKTQLKKIVHPSMRKIMKTAPQGIYPKWKTGDAHYEFPNGAQLHIAGCDDTESMEALRGTESHLNIVTEGGSIQRLKYLLSDILIPQTLTTKGKTFVDSTPPPDPHHYFNILVDEGKKNRNYSEYTIEDNTSIDPLTRETFIKEAGGRDDPSCQREYFCKRTRDGDTAIIPEFSHASHVKEFVRPDSFRYFDRYMGLDLGLVDKSVCVYAYYDFERGVLCVEDEVTLQGRDMTSSALGKLISDKKTELWGELDVYRQVSDNNNLQSINDLNQMFGTRFIGTKKNTLHGMVNNLRNMFKANRVEIHPRCVEVIGCVDSGAWDKRQSKFATHPVWGHFDGLAALVYLNLNIDQRRNPMPAGIPDMINNFYLQFEESPVDEAINKIFERFSWRKR